MNIKNVACNSLSPKCKKGNENEKLLKLLFNTSHIKNNSTCATYFPTSPLSLYQNYKKQNKNNRGTKQRKQKPKTR